MKKALVIILALIMTLTGAMGLAEAATLNVHGTGVVNVDADTATIILGVREVSKDVADAQRAVNTKIESVTQALMDMGIEPEDIHTSSISIYPEYDYDSMDQPIKGYTAENTISVTTRDVEHVGAYIDAAFGAGANAFNDISFSTSDLTDESRQALGLAVENGREKAEVLAAASGMKLGDIKCIVEEPNSYGDFDVRFAKAEAAAGDAGTPVYASKLQVSASVTIEYELLPKD